MKTNILWIDTYIYIYGLHSGANNLRYIIYKTILVLYFEYCMMMLIDINKTQLSKSKKA